MPKVVRKFYRDGVEYKIKFLGPKADGYYSNENWSEYQDLVDTIGSVQFQDTGSRFRFNFGVYIGNRTALDFNANSNQMRTINLDTLTSTTKTLSVTMPNRDLQIYRIAENRILTPRGILDYQGNVITSFSYDGVVPGDEGILWAHSGYDIYKGIVDANYNVEFTKVGTSGTDQSVGNIHYGRAGAYLLNGNDTSGSGLSAYVNPITGEITNFGGESNSRQVRGASGADGKMYRICIRYNGWGRMQKIGTTGEGLVGNSLSTSRTSYGNRFGKFLGNIAAGGMNYSNGQGNGYGSNNYFIDTDGTLTHVQSNALAYDTGIDTTGGFIDEKGWIYPRTHGGGSGVILKTDKTFTNLNWKNPYLFR